MDLSFILIIAASSILMSAMMVHAEVTSRRHSIHQTANTRGRFVRDAGDTIKLVSGQFAGAVGYLQPDKSGAPAVYFERDENRTAANVHIVDPQRTSCTVKR